MALTPSSAFEEETSEEAIKSTKKKDKTKKRAKDVVQTPKPLVEALQDEADAMKAEKKKKRKTISDGRLVAEEGGVEKDAGLERGTERRKRRLEHASGEGHDASADMPTKNPLPQVGRSVKEKKERKKEKTKEQAASRGENASTAERESTDKRERKEKKKQRLKEGPTTTSIDEQPAGKTKEKRKKRKNESDDDAGTEAKTLAPTGESEPKKKKHKRAKHGYPDPSTDEEISEQAKKALTYAYVHVEEPETWKFNKARQNWLIRNIWSDAAIPDRYVTLVNRYLTGMQGGSREAFLKTCQNLSASLEESPEAVANGITLEKPSDQADVVASTSPFKIQRARVLLQLLEQKDTI